MKRVLLIPGLDCPYCRGYIADYCHLAFIEDSGGSRLTGLAQGCLLEHPHIAIGEPEVAAQTGMVEC